MGVREWNVESGKRNILHSLRHLNTWSSIGDTVWVKLWRVAVLLEELCHCEQALRVHSLLCLCG